MTEAFMINSSSGIVVSVNLRADTVPCINSPLRCLKRSISWPIRTNTRMSLMPVKFSCITPFTVSILACTSRNLADVFFIIQITNHTNSGTVTTSNKPSLKLTTRAIIMLPVTSRGTLVAKRRLMNTISCSCVMSPVNLVIKEEA
ncbi:hypothetical protein D3C73_1359340 [compost metagenome]